MKKLSNYMSLNYDEIYCEHPEVTKLTKTQEMIVDAVITLYCYNCVFGRKVGPFPNLDDEDADKGNLIDLSEVKQLVQIMDGGEEVGEDIEEEVTHMLAQPIWYKVETSDEETLNQCICGRIARVNDGEWVVNVSTIPIFLIIAESVGAISFVRTKVELV